MWLSDESVGDVAKSAKCGKLDSDGIGPAFTSIVGLNLAKGDFAAK
jgi:hypothetical protein